MNATLQRVLIVAENASVRFGGEAILPFHYFRLLRQRGIDAHLIVHDRVRAELQELFPNDAAHLHFVPDQGLQKFFFRLGRLLPRRVEEATLGLANQMLTQRAQRAVVRSLVVEGTVVHQPIPVSPRFPSLLYGFAAPVLIGPLNGGMEYPPAFAKAESLLSRAVIALGRSFADAGNRMLPGKLRAAVVLVANERTRDALPAGITGRIVTVPENGVDLSAWPQHTIAPEPGRFLFIGRLVDWKALDIVLDALAQVPEALLEVIGDGPMLAPWRAHAEANGTAGRVTFRGWLSQAACAERLAASQAMLLPGVYECGGAVVLEAMAMQRPVIATAWGGPASYLDETCGVLIQPASRQSMVDGFAQSMRHFIANPGSGHTLGQAGRQRVLTHFDWQQKVEAIIAIYREAL